MIVAAHQPAYVPTLGYLDKLAKADVFVVMDDLQCAQLDHRQRLKLAHGPHWLTVPLAGSRRARIVDARVDNTGLGGRHHWAQRTWRTIVVHYGRASWFDRYAAELERLFAGRWDFLVDLDLALLELARAWLRITVPVIRSSSLQLSGRRTERIARLCERLGAHRYLAGTADGLDGDLVASRGITVAWHRFAHPTYPQCYPHLGFCPQLGFLDLVLNCGPASAGRIAGCNGTDPT